nr:hypothetical protein Itr_chr01CG04660 [Ipomoea trifida]
MVVMVAVAMATGMVVIAEEIWISSSTARFGFHVCSKDDHYLSIAGKCIRKPYTHFTIV